MEESLAAQGQLEAGSGLRVQERDGRGDLWQLNPLCQRAYPNGNTRLTRQVQGTVHFVGNLLVVFYIAAQEEGPVNC